MGLPFDQEIVILAYFLISLSSLIIALHFGYRLIYYFTLRLLLRFAGFGLLAFSFGSVIFTDSTSPLFFWFAAAGFYILLLNSFFDTHAKVNIILFPGIIASFFLSQHIFLFVQTLLLSITNFQLVGASTKHNDLIYPGVAFLLLAIAEYFYFLESMHGYGDLTQAGAFIEIFAALALFVWISGLLTNSWRKKMKF